MINRLKLFHGFPFFLGLILISLLPGVGYSWGTWGHEHLTAAALEDLPLSMETIFHPAANFIISTSTDNGVRTSWDPHESDFHFINLSGTRTGSCQWPNFGSCMPQTQALFLSTFGYSSIGFNCYIVDSLAMVLSTSYRTWNANPTPANYTTAMVWMCRVAHYMEDLSQPLHVTWNYDPNNVHSRYESNMISTYTPSISSTIGSGAVYQSNVLQYAFSMVSISFPYGASIGAADTAAQNAAGGSTSSTTYYTYLWASTRSFTTTLLNLSAKTVASVWYTAWKNAGLVPVTDWELYDTPLVIPSSRKIN